MHLGRLTLERVLVNPNRLQEGRSHAFVASSPRGFAAGLATRLQ
jgi:hypothetical protein